MTANNQYQSNLIFYITGSYALSSYAKVELCPDYSDDNIQMRNIIYRYL